MRKAPRRILKRPAHDQAASKPSFPYSPDADLAEASRLARVVAILGVGGKTTPLVSPIGDRDDFDRALCEAGIKRFVRRRFDTDWPEASGYTRPHVLVEELAPGVRHRSELVVVMNHEMN